MKKMCMLAMCLVVSLLFTVSCAVDKSTDTDEIEIDHIGWVLDNIENGFFVGDTTGDPSCFYNLSIYLKGSDIDYSDIEYARMTYDDRYFWEFVISDSNFISDMQVIGSQRFFSLHFSENGSVLPIGTMEFEVKLKNGNSDKYTFTIPAPDSTGTDGYNFIYNEDYTDTPGSNYVSMLKRAVIEDASSDTTNDTIGIEFAVNDERVYSGRVNFHNAAGTYVGGTNYFKDTATDTTTDVGNKLNSNGTLLTNGDTNKLILNTTNDITYVDKYTAEDIAAFVIVLTDGRQYSSTKSTYDCRSFTKRTGFTE